MIKCKTWRTRSNNKRHTSGKMGQPGGGATHDTHPSTTLAQTRLTASSDPVH
jgi:hypothetical protein